MLHLTRLISERKRIVLQLEGRLLDCRADLLRETCRALQARMRVPLWLDLLAVGYASRSGLELLRQLEREGIRSVARSPFLEQRL